jgi:DNA-binding transcriptional LysR family regulator
MQIRTGLSELTAFLAVAEHRSFRAAAKQLGLSPPALSHAVRGLEESLNVRLFNRTTRSVALTEAGEHLLRRVGPALADLQEGIDEVASAGTRPSGSIRISAAEAGARPLLLNVLPTFLQTYPDIHVEIVVDTRLVDIVADGFDAGIRVLDDVPRDMIAIRFGPDLRFAAVASPEYLAGRAIPKTPQELMQHRCIRFRFASGALFRWELERHGSSANLDVNGPLTLGSTNLMVDAALAGIGIAWVPEYHVMEHIAAGRLIHLLPEWSPSLPGLSLYYPANRHPPAALRLFSQAVKEWADRNR